jgi:hypothetical protein
LQEIGTAAVLCWLPLLLLHLVRCCLLCPKVTGTLLLMLLPMLMVVWRSGAEAAAGTITGMACTVP